MSNNPKNATMQQRKAALRQRSAKLEGFNSEDRTVNLSFASEAPVTDYWGEPEILRCTDEAMDIKRFADGVMPILYNHKRDEVIGKPLKLWTENGRAMATIQFANTAKAEEIMGLVRDGFLNGVSVGYRVNEWQVIEKGQSSVDGIAGPAWIATRWEVFEISIVTVPADGTVGVGRSLLYGDLPESQKENDNESEERKMAEPKNPTPQATPEPTPNLDNIRAEAQRAERERCLQIAGLCKDFQIDDEQRQKWIDGGCEITTVNRELLEILNKRNAPVPRVQMGESEEEKLRAARRDALLMRNGVNVEKPAPGASELRHMSVRDMARDMLSRAGEKNVYALDDGTLYERALTTGALPSLLKDATDFSMKQGFARAAGTYDKWAYIGSLPDFRESNIVDISADADPKLIPENGEFTDASMKESKETVRLQTYGRSYSYTRQAFINDDVSVLTRIPEELAYRMGAYINHAAYEALTKAKFETANTGTGAALSTDSLAEAMAKLRLAKDASKNTLRIMPRFLIVPVAQYVKAAQLITSAADPNGAHSGVNNPFRGALEIITDPELDAADADAWYLAGAPAYGYGVQVNFLNGNRTPILESKQSFDVLGWKYRMYLDFGVKALSTLGYVKNAGK